MSKQVYPNIVGIGKTLKKLRIKKGLTQTELAKMINCSQGTIAEWERNSARAPSRKLLHLICEALNISLNDLANTEKSPQPKTPCYDEISSYEFIWKQSYSKHKRFSFIISDDFGSPLIEKGDEAVFEKGEPKDGDIVIIRFSNKKNKALIRMWRENRPFIMFSEINLEKLENPYIAELHSQDGNRYTMKKPKDIVFVEGKLMMVKKPAVHTKKCMGIKCVFS